MNAGQAKAASAGKVLASNRKASFSYQLLEKFEAGIELQGAEVKSIREGHVSLNESFARIESGQVYIHGMHVQPYTHSRSETHDPVRPRRLLLHRTEINRLTGQVAEKGRTLVPVKLYLKHGFIKIEIALGKGKELVDKRETIKRRTADRETARAIANHSRGR
ncbi:MAG: SsrA-binding protein SmpB [Kiritimatiellia bacterium]|jgi:SsrA-binding protein